MKGREGVGKDGKKKRGSRTRRDGREMRGRARVGYLSKCRRVASYATASESMSGKNRRRSLAPRFIDGRGIDELRGI